MLFYCETVWICVEIIYTFNCIILCFCIVYLFAYVHDVWDKHHCQFRAVPWLVLLQHLNWTCTKEDEEKKKTTVLTSPCSWITLFVHTTSLCSCPQLWTGAFGKSLAFYDKKYMFIFIFSVFSCSMELISCNTFNLQQPPFNVLRHLQSISKASLCFLRRVTGRMSMLYEILSFSCRK